MADIYPSLSLSREVAEMMNFFRVLSGRNLPIRRTRSCLMVERIAVEYRSCRNRMKSYGML